MYRINAVRWFMISGLFYSSALAGFTQTFMGSLGHNFVYWFMIYLGSLYFGWAENGNSSHYEDENFGYFVVVTLYCIISGLLGGGLLVLVGILVVYWAIDHIAFRVLHKRYRTQEKERSFLEETQSTFPLTMEDWAQNVPGIYVDD